MRKFILISILILAILGALDASYLLIKTISSQSVACPSVSISRFNLGQCNIVLFSSYAKTAGLPNALYGLGAYLFFSVLALYELTEKRNKDSIKLLSYLSGFGILVFVYFIYLQLFVIRALCFYCLASSLTMTLIFALSVVYNLRYSAVEGV